MQAPFSLQWKHLSMHRLYTPLSLRAGDFQGPDGTWNPEGNHECFDGGSGIGVALLGQVDL